MVHIMIIELVIAGLLIAGLIGGNEYLSQQASSPESKASVASETAIQPPRPAPIEVDKSAAPLGALVSAEEATRPAQQEEQQHADTIGPVAPPDDVSGGSIWKEDDDNFDSWAK